MNVQPHPARSPARIIDALRGSGPVFSFEFFPPKTPGEARTLERTIAELVPLEPAFVSVTDRAGSAAQGLTRELVARIISETGLTAMGHMTCVAHSRDEMRAVLADLRDAGIQNILPLRGDPPRGETAFTPRPDGFAYASELIRYIRSEGFDFCLGAACYPEGHTDAEDRDADLANLKRKVDAGVDFLITQLFLDNAFYFDFVARARAAGITVPIIPGLKIVTGHKQLQTIPRNFYCEIPFDLADAIEKAKPERVLDVGVEWALAQTRELLERKVPSVHFYIMQSSAAINRLLPQLDL